MERRIFSDSEFFSFDNLITRSLGIKDEISRGLYTESIIKNTQLKIEQEKVWTVFYAAADKLVTSYIDESKKGEFGEATFLLELLYESCYSRRGLQDKNYWRLTDFVEETYGFKDRIRNLFTTVFSNPDEVAYLGNINNLLETNPELVWLDHLTVKQLCIGILTYSDETI